MNELLQKAIERRNALRQELAALDALILAYSRQPPSDRPQQVDLFAPVTAKVERSPLRRAEYVSKMMDDAERLILEAGKPLTRFDLLEQLERLGWVVEGGDKSKVLGTNLWRSTRFHNIRGLGYWPKSAPIPKQYTRFEIRDTKLS